MNDENGPVTSDSNATDVDANTGADEQEKWCFAWFASAPTAQGADRAALVKGAKWPQGEIITISFLDGQPDVQKKVKSVAQQWAAPTLANLTLVFRDGTTATDIRISFRYRGSWSVIGTTCRQIVDHTQPTMNFGWLNEHSTTDEIRRVVLHEFGHALGLIHEHQNPGGSIQWNREQVIKDLSGPPNNWSPEVIQHNMFEPYEKKETNYTGLDAASIMMYPIPAKWTKNGFSVGLNSNLSSTDKQFIHEQYP